MEAYRARAHYGSEEGYFSLDGVEKWHRRVGAVMQFHRPLPDGPAMQVVQFCSWTRPKARGHILTLPSASLSTSQSACLTNCTPATQSLIFPSPFVQSRTSVSVDYTSPDLSLVARGGPAARARKGLSPHPRHSRASLPAAPFQRRPKTCRLLGSLH